MEYWKREHNRPISIVIKGYMDKKGGKVTDSRKEIQRRFDGLDWEYQKQIFFCILAVWRDRQRLGIQEVISNLG